MGQFDVSSFTGAGGGSSGGSAVPHRLPVIRVPAAELTGRAGSVGTLRGEELRVRVGKNSLALQV